MSVVSPNTREALAPAELVLRWAGVLEDPTLRNLPYRIELNKWGHIEMTPPASPRHMSIASSLVRLLEDRLGSQAFTECAIVTSGGLRVADVVWCSTAFLTRHIHIWEKWSAAFEEAPELCIEVMSPSNTYGELQERVQLYLDAGAQEAWIVHSSGQLDVFGAEGLRAASRLVTDWTSLLATMQELTRSPGRG
ncbi:MAG: Uma2 family endonuclease [Chromatiales bacterium]